MYVLTADEIRQVENNCFDGYSTEAQLMLKAGTACYDAVMKNYGTDIFSKRIFVLCGNGKNAGDGFVMARLFYSAGIDVKIVLCDKEPIMPESISPVPPMASDALPVRFTNTASPSVITVSAPLRTRTTPY
jgi:ADP-dependent NAD(P)H-hydrate dehydratase / NAD(P)H-hydrate epimerase